MALRKSKMERVHVDFSKVVDDMYHKQDGMVTKVNITKQIAKVVKSPPQQQKKEPMFGDFPFKIKGKRGAVEDVFFLMILLFIFAVFFLFMFYFEGKLSDAITPVYNNVSSDGNAGALTFGYLDRVFDNTANYAYLAIFMSLLIATVITAFLTPTHPIFFVFAVVLFMALVVVSAIMSNAYETLSGISEFSAADSTLSIQSDIMARLPLIMVAIGVLVSVVLYSRSKAEMTQTQ